MAKKYASGLISLVFTVTDENIQLLLNNMFDCVALFDSATGTTVNLEVGTLDVEQLVQLGDNEEEDIPLL